MTALARLAPAPDARPRPSRAGDPGFGIYIHWPFCRAKCPYCDFNSHVRALVDQRRWRRALLAELDYSAAGTSRRDVTSIFFGGGTPSLMDPETVQVLIERIARHWRLVPEAEITLEANPTSVEAGRFAAYRAAGINRVSLGIQALDDSALEFLGREHSAAEALGALEIARRHFPRWSFDLIYARPEQDPAAWRAELARALEQAPTHLSVYQLTIEKGTAFHGAWRRGEIVPPGEIEAAGLYRTTQALLRDAGLPGYEISNHARPGTESRHNLTYWRYGDYLGVGPGAHGRLTRTGAMGRRKVKLAITRRRAPEAWLAAVEREGHGTLESKALSRQDRLSELVIMGLRLREGIGREAFRREAGGEPEEVLAGQGLGTLVAAGFLELDAHALRATPRGRLRLNAVLGRLLP